MFIRGRKFSANIKIKAWNIVYGRGRSTNNNNDIRNIRIVLSCSGHS